MMLRMDAAPSDASTASPAGPWALAALGLLLPLAVLWSVEYPPLADAPNHLARHYLEALHLQGEPLPPGYAVTYRNLPNLGGDLVLPFLMMAWAPQTAGKVFLSLSLVLLWGGAAALIRQAGGNPRAAAAAAGLLLPFTLNSALFWGFLNYYSGLGLAFLAVVHLIRLERRPRVGAADLLGHAALVALLFFWHLAAVFIYGAIAGCRVLALVWGTYRTRAGVTVGSLPPGGGGLGWGGSLCEGEPPHPSPPPPGGREEEGRVPESGASLWPLLGPPLRFGLTLAPAAVLFLLYSAAKADLPTPPSTWGDPLHKLRGLLVPFRGYHTAADVLVVGLWAAAVLALFGRGLLRPARAWPLLAAAALLGLYVALPYQWGSTSDADTRLLPPLLVCLVAGLARLPVRHPRAGAALLAVALVVRCGSTGVAWQGFDGRLQEAARSFDRLGTGSRVLPAVLVPGPGREYAEAHFVCLATIARRAYVPTLFAMADQQPLARLDPRPLPGRFRGGEYTVDDDAARARFDYLWVYNPHGAAVRLPDHWRQVFRGQHVQVWAISAPATVAAAHRR